MNPKVAKALKANNGKLISEMEDLTGKTPLVKSDPLLHQENFDIHLKPAAAVAIALVS